MFQKIKKEATDSYSSKNNDLSAFDISFEVVELPT